MFSFAPPLVQLAGAVPRHPLESLARMSAVDALTEAAQAAVSTLGRRVRGRTEVVRSIGRAGQE